MNKLNSRYVRAHKCIYLPLDAFIFTLLFLAFSLPVWGQQNAGANRSGRVIRNETENPNVLRWKIFLASLAQESRTVFPEDRRPYAIVDVAVANWQADREVSRSLFISALDSALSLTRKDKKYQGLVNHVISAATRLDGALAKELSKRLLDEEKANDDIASEAALDLLNDNPEAAARLAESFAPTGLDDGTAAFLIFGLAEKDIALSDRVLSAYLNRVRADEKIPLSSVLNLAGYSFGYSEYYSVDKNKRLIGASLVPVEGLSGRSGFSNAFFDLAFHRISISIDKRDQTLGGELESLNFSILFALEYLMPEVIKFSPNQLPRWQQLQERGATGATLDQVQLVQNYVQNITRSRLKARKTDDSDRNLDTQIEASLDEVEELPGTCQRDRAYSKAALHFSARKNFKRALEIAGNIEDLKQGESVKEVISINKAEAMIESGELDEALKLTEKISSLPLKALMYVRLVRAFSAKNDIQQAGDAANNAAKIVEKLEDPADQAGILFSLSTILSKSDPIESRSLLRNAIKAINKLKPEDEMDFSIPLKVQLSCEAGDDTWYGSFETLPDSTVFAALSVFAKQDPDEANRSAEEIADKITRIRASAKVTAIALSNLNTTLKNSKAVK